MPADRNPGLIELLALAGAGSGQNSQLDRRRHQVFGAA
jgi:hypothetical protein